jgi:hypothetical protein
MHARSRTGAREAQSSITSQRQRVNRPPTHLAGDGQVPPQRRAPPHVKRAVVVEVDDGPSPGLGGPCDARFAGNARRGIAPRRLLHRGGALRTDAWREAS